MKISQPYFVYNSDGFREEPYQKLGISRFYTFKVTQSNRLGAVPDGCFSIIFQYFEGEMHAFACGPVLSYTKCMWPAGSEIFGICFSPGNHPAGWKKPLRDLSDHMVEIDESYWDMTLVESMKGKVGFHQRIQTFLNHYPPSDQTKVRPYGKQELITTVKNMIRESDGKIRISLLAERTGYSERYVNKVFAEGTGLSPKNYCKIIQFQRSMEYLSSGAIQKMTSAAVELGYYDQPQFIRDFERYAGMTPARFVKFIDKVCL